MGVLQNTEKTLRIDLCAVFYGNFSYFGQKRSKKGGQQFFGVQRDFNEILAFGHTTPKIFEIKKFLLPQVTPTLYLIDG